MSTNTIVMFVIAGATAALLLVAATAPSFAGRAFGPPNPGRPWPKCEAACQTNKARPPVKLEAGKSTGATDTTGRSSRPQ